MLNFYTGLRCAAGPTRLALQRRAAGYVSLGHLVGGGKGQHAIETEQAHTDEDRGHTDPTSEDVRSTELPPLSKATPHKSGLPSFLSKAQSHDENSQAATVHDREISVGQIDHSSRSSEIFEDHINRLGKLAPWKEIPLQEVWGLCKTLLVSQTWRSAKGIKLSELQVQVFELALLRTTEESQSNPSGRSVVPAQTKILHYFRQANLLGIPILVKVLRLQIAHLLDIAMAQRGGSPSPFDSMAPMLVDDLLATWQHLYDIIARRTKMPIKADRNQALEDEIPNVEIRDTGYTRAGEDIHIMSEQQYAGLDDASSKLITAAAVLTQSILHSGLSRSSGSTARQTAEKLDEFIDNESTGEDSISIFLEGSQTTGYAIALAKSIYRPMHKHPGSTNETFERAGSAQKRQGNPTIQHIDFLKPRQIISEIQKTLKEADVSKLTSLWQEYSQRLGTGQVCGDPDQDVLCDFTKAFFVLRCSDLAMGVWNTMGEYKIAPKKRYWRAILVGCQIANDAVSLESFWSRMIASNIVPNEAMWTTRVQTLIAGGDWRKGITALEELSSTWKTNATQKSQTPRSKQEDEQDPALISPLGPLKEAIVGLLSTGHHGVADKLFTWAKSLSLPLDTRIFNILLKPRVRGAYNVGEIYAYVADMESYSCMPDAHTYTLLFNGILSNSASDFQSKSPQQQITFLTSMLDGMEYKNIIPNEYTYSTILSGLLSGPPSSNRPPDDTIARAILDRMTQASAAGQVKPSAHFFTIFMTHYFSLHPPSLQAVSSLWHSMSGSQEIIKCLDDIFYDRMVENYARVGDTEKMLYFLRKMPEQRKTPGWMALLATLRRLVEIHDWDGVAELIRDVKGGAGKGLLRFAQRPKKGMREFWQLAGRCKEEGYITV